MSQTLSFNDLRVGDRWESQGRTVTEADIVNFAGITGDFDPLHMNHEYAKQTPFGRPIAHGLLGLSLLAGLGTNAPRIRTVALVSLQHWEFLRPIYIGDTVHAVNEVVGLQPNARRRGRVTWKRQLMNQRREIVQAGVFETLVEIGEAQPKAPTKSIQRKARRSA